LSLLALMNEITLFFEDYRTPCFEEKKLYMAKQTFSLYFKGKICI